MDEEEDGMWTSIEPQEDNKEQRTTRRNHLLLQLHARKDTQHPVLLLLQTRQKEVFRRKINVSS